MRSQARRRQVDVGVLKSTASRRKLIGSYVMRTFPAGPELLNPYPFFSEMRQQYPVAFDERANLWSVYRHADVSAALADPESFANSTAEAGAMPDVGTRRFASLVAFDPPRHTRMRNLVMRAFTSSAVARLEGSCAR